MEETMEDTMEGTMEGTMDMEEPNLEAEANCTMWNVSCLQVGGSCNCCFGAGGFHLQWTDSCCKFLDKHGDFLP